MSGVPGKPAGVLAEPEAYSVQGTSYGDFDPGVLAPNASHEAATLVQVSSGRASRLPPNMPQASATQSRKLPSDSPTRQCGRLHARTCIRQPVGGQEFHSAD